jgi:hypothetical protein
MKYEELTIRIPESLYKWIIEETKKDIVQPDKSDYTETIVNSLRNYKAICERDDSY